MKKSGEFAGAETKSLEWEGTIPGKRQSRRFEGDHMLNQHDVVEQRHHPDAVAVGGWSLDLHPADVVYGKSPSCMQWHTKGVYGIPYRCYYCRNVENLFLAGRLISASHVAFGSSRVMLACAHGSVAVGVAAAHCTRGGLLPRGLTAPERMRALQANPHFPALQSSPPASPPTSPPTSPPKKATKVKEASSFAAYFAEATKARKATADKTTGRPVRPNSSFRGLPQKAKS